jgi:FAD/FMN-containing dehydrogenase
VAGLTLGGGLGYLSRRFGWTVDNLLEVETVTADGRVRRASRDESPDLFWAVRGAGANLGVVTSFTFRLHAVGPVVHGGLVLWSFARADEILAAYRTIAAEAPRELSVWMLMLHAPPAPFVPEPWHGRKVCAMVVCHSGAPEDADAALAPIRALPDPVVDLVGPMPYTEVQSYLDDGEPRGHHYYWKSEFVAELPDELLAATRDLFAQCPIPGAEIGFLHLGGAIGDLAGDDGAVGNRDARFVFGITGMWEPGHPGAEGFPGWVRDGWERIRPFSTGGNYVNFQTADEGDERVRATYGPRYDRLARIKETYDPNNLFRSNRNVCPH